MKGLNLNLDNLANSNEEVAVETDIPAINRLKKSSGMSGNGITKKLHNGRTVNLKRVVVKADEVSKVSVFRSNERIQDMLNPEAVADIYPSIKAGGVDDEPIGRKVDGGIEIADGSRRRYAAYLAGVDLPVLVGDLTDDEMEFISEVRNYHKKPSAYERGKKWQRWLEQGKYSSQLDLSNSMNIDRTEIIRCIRVAELPREIIDAFPTVNHLTVDAGVKLHKFLESNQIPDEVISERIKRCQEYHEKEKSAKFYLQILTAMPRKQAEVDTWWVKDKVKQKKSKGGLQLNLNDLNEEQEKQLQEFIEQLYK